MNTTKIEWTGKTWNTIRGCNNVPFFFKQWGGVKKAETGRMLHGRTFDEMPAIVTAPLSKEARLAKMQKVRDLIADQGDTDNV